MRRLDNRGLTLFIFTALRILWFLNHFSHFYFFIKGGGGGGGGLENGGMGVCRDVSFEMPSHIFH